MLSPACPPLASQKLALYNLPRVRKAASELQGRELEGKRDPSSGGGPSPGWCLGDVRRGTGPEFPKQVAIAVWRLLRDSGFLQSRILRLPAIATPPRWCSSRPQPLRRSDSLLLLNLFRRLHRLVPPPPRGALFAEAFEPFPRRPRQSKVTLPPPQKSLF